MSNKPRRREEDLPCFLLSPDAPPAERRHKYPEEEEEEEEEEVEEVEDVEVCGTQTLSTASEASGITGTDRDRPGETPGPTGTDRDRRGPTGTRAGQQVIGGVLSLRLRVFLQRKVETRRLVAELRGRGADGGNILDASETISWFFR
ncbi:hypothetical protein F2P81_020729 [Scophthalmus maximus]|uniref:Uncharacterized protein n=1 Tax=Scophthalmus maximus TaxID=52904 RepID=A0A6A4S6Z8_SCOMX|nr:hypothetical protein F2P81_020729 [Scophthalmus maximus]